MGGALRMRQVPLYRSPMDLQPSGFIFEGQSPDLELQPPGMWGLIPVLYKLPNLRNFVRAAKTCCIVTCHNSSLYFLLEKLLTLTPHCQKNILEWFMGTWVPQHFQVS